MKGNIIGQKSQDVIYPLTLGDLQTSGQDLFLGLERENGSKGGSQGFFPH